MFAFFNSVRDLIQQNRSRFAAGGNKRIRAADTAHYISLAACALAPLLWQIGNLGRAARQRNA